MISHILLIPILNVNPRFIHYNDTKNASVVRAVLQRVVEVSVQQTGRTPTPVRLISDYELAILSWRFQTYFLQGSKRLLLSFWHGRCCFSSVIFSHTYIFFLYRLCTYKYGCSVGLTIAYRTKENVRLLVKMSVTLALLPPEKAYTVNNTSHFKLRTVHGNLVYRNVSYSLRKSWLKIRPANR